MIDGARDLQTEWRPVTFHWVRHTTDWFDEGWQRVFGAGPDEMPPPVDHVEFVHLWHVPWL